MSRRIIYFGLLIAGATIVSWPALIAVYKIALQDDQQSHILLILPVSLALLYFEWPKINRNAEYCLPAGVIVALCVVLSLGITRHYSQHPLNISTIQMCVFVGCCISAFVFCYGLTAFRAVAFTLLFLFLMVPLPDFLLERTIWFLQRGSTDVTVLLLKATQIPVWRNGFVLSLPGFDLEVARECSGIRSSLVLVVVAIVLGHLFVRSNWKRSFLVLLVLPIAIVRNGFRIFALSAMGTLVDPSFLNGNFHRYGGIPLFALSLGFLALIIWWLRKSEIGTSEGFVPELSKSG